MTRSRDALGECLGVGEVTRGDDDRELLASRPAHVVTLADGRAELGGELGEHLVAHRVAVDVVDPLEVVEVEHQERHRAALGRGPHDLVAEAFVERPVVPEAGEWICLGLELEARSHLGVVEGEGGCVSEANRELELVVRELVQTDPVDVERALDASTGDQWHGDERLGIGRCTFDEAHAGIEVCPVGEDRLAMLDGPPGDSLTEGERLVGDHLVGVVAAGKDPAQLARNLVGLVEGEVVVRNEIADGVGDALEQGIEGLLRENVVEDVREAAVRLDECDGGG